MGSKGNLPVILLALATQYLEDPSRGSTLVRGHLCNLPGIRRYHLEGGYLITPSTRDRWMCYQVHQACFYLLQVYQTHWIV